MARVRYFWHGFIHRGATFMYLQYSRITLFFTFCQKYGKRRYTISASIFVDVPYWPHNSMDKFHLLCSTGSLAVVFHFDEEIVITWTHIGWILWMFWNRGLQLAARGPPAALGQVLCGPGRVFHKTQCVMNIEAWVTRHYSLWLKENKFTVRSKILNNYPKL